ncbi:hypothetical protein FW774_19780 [Pedobacter sp. BS3]|uniref:hypothetical protein n=1 Tax=Pedobacter sp. BS3 TaxID=2567937 RepID=UPI0011EE4161|nr:hypothetical protein [Pedobacter sp. BS3]TZF80989.1 hypothetical protein FW774_19780 [Pedobacter sp. BS3]
MKRLFLTAIIALFLGVASHAQEKKATFSWNKETMEQLGLSADQQQKITEIRKKASADRKALTADTTLSDEDKKAKAKQMSKETNDAISAVLTPEQNEKVKEMKKAIKEQNAAKQ